MRTCVWPIITFKDCRRSSHLSTSALRMCVNPLATSNRSKAGNKSCLYREVEAISHYSKSLTNTWLLLIIHLADRRTLSGEGGLLSSSGSGFSDRSTVSSLVQAVCWLEWEELPLRLLLKLFSRGPSRGTGGRWSLAPRFLLICFTLQLLLRTTQITNSNPVEANLQAA